MLAIRLQRTGRKGLAQYRVIVQEARLHPSSGRVVALLGSFDPHTKKATITKDKTEFYLSHGAQPSPRVVRLLTAEGISMPKWVETPPAKSKTIRNAEKLRKNRPAESAAPAEAPAESAEPAAEAETEATEAAEEQAETTADNTETSEPEATETATENESEQSEDKA